LELNSPIEALDPNSILEVSKSAVFENRMAPLIAEEELSFNPYLPSPFSIDSAKQMYIKTA